MPYLSSRDLLTPFHIECIGSIHTEWALLEATISITIWDYCRLDRDNGLAVTADLGSLAKISMLSALARLRFPDPSDALTKILTITGEMRALNTERNIISHNLWAMGYVASRIQSKRITAKDGKLKEAPINKTDNELGNIFSRIAAVIERLEDFQKEYDVRSPSRPKPRRP